MNTKYFIDPDLAIEFVQSLQENNTVDVAKMADETFKITWIENKKYTTYDGKEFVDEVWTKEDGTMIVCQDLELDHAKNIIRMILRQNRERMIAEEAIYEQIDSALSSIMAGGSNDEQDQDDLPGWMDILPETKTVYH